MTRSGALKLLIVDDHPPMRETLRALLTPLASEIHEASDGSAAIPVFDALQPDWVVMDVEMKPMNGLVATREIRRRSPFARIVIITQHEDVDLRAFAAAAGACACFSKEDLAAIFRLFSESAAVGPPPLPGMDAPPACLQPTPA